VTDIIIPVYDHADYLRLCLDSIRRCTSDYRIIIVDAGSTEDAVFDMYEELSDCTVIKDRGRLTFAQACNIGIAQAQSDAVCILNSDVVVSTGWLNKLRGHLASDPMIALVSPTSNFHMPILDLSYYQTMETLSAKALSLDAAMEAVTGSLEDKPVVEFFACLIRRGLAVLDEAYENGAEDYDLCTSLRERGYRICMAGDVFVFHFGGISRGRDKAQVANDKNIKLYASKWDKIPTIVVLPDDQDIDRDVLTSLMKQTAKVDPVYVREWELEAGQTLTTRLKLRLGSRNPHVYFHDRGMVLPSSDYMKRAVDIFGTDYKCGVVLFSQDGSSMLVKMELFLNLDYEIDPAKRGAFLASVKRMGYTVLRIG